MARYKLVYFRGRSRAEIVRLIFHAAGEDFQDVQLDDHSWAELKTTSPTGSLPMLINLDTNETLVQSMAIARYVAREFGLAGNDQYQMALVDSVADAMNDLLGDVVEITFEDESRRKKERIRRFHERALPETADYLENFIERYAGNSGYSVGNNDQIVLAGICGWRDFERYRRIHEIVRRIEETPRFSSYLQQRPAAAF